MSVLETALVGARERLTRLPRLSWEPFISAFAVALALAGWWAVARYDLASDLFVPSPLDTWEAFVDIARDGYRGVPLRTHLYDSLYRVTIGFSLAVVSAVPLGLAMGMNRKIRAFFEPFIEFYRPLPPLSYYTLLVLWFGIENDSKIALLYLAALPPLVISTIAGVESIRVERLWSAKSLGAKPWQVFRYIVLPSSLPHIFTGMRVSIGFTYSTLVAAELVAGRSGIGWMALDASKFLRSDVIFVAVAIMGITGILLDRLIRAAEAVFVPWKGHD